MPILSFLCPACDLPGAGIEGEADPGLNFVFMVVWRASFSSRPQTLLYPIVVAVIFPVDCSEENFGFHSQASRIILSLTPVLCGHVEFLDPPNDTPLSMKHIVKNVYFQAKNTKGFVDWLHEF